MTNLALNLAASAARHPDRPALRLDDTTLTYQQLDDLAGRAAGRMAALGVGPGDRVGVMLPNVVEFPVLFYGALRLGAVVVPMNPLFKGREIAHHTRDSDMSLLWAHQMVAEQDTAQAAEGVRVERVDGSLLPGLADVEPLPYADRADADTAVILYTSGTTGTPKGAELTHTNLRRNVEVTRDLVDVGPEDVILGCLPLFHATGQTSGMSTAIYAGAALTLLPRWDVEQALRIVERDRVTIFMGVPTMYVALLSAGPQVADTSTLRLCTSGGAALPAEVLRAFAEAFGAEILEGYGLSETSPIASFNHPGDTRPGSIGKPIAGVEMKIVDDAGNEVPTGEVGEIAIRGHNVMKGYWRRPEATEAAIEDGWFHSGDIGRKDDDGFFSIVDRKKDMIIRGGFNVYPREIEEVLYEHPAVREAAVVGLPHPTHGEEIGAAVALHPDRRVSEEELREHVKSRVAPYKYPRVVWFVDELPKGATGKILKREIEAPREKP